MINATMYVDRTGKIPPSVTKHKHSKLSTVHTQYVEDQDHELFVRRPMGARCWMLGVIQGPEIVQLAIQNPPRLVDCAQITVDAGWKVVFLRTWTVYRQCPYYLVSFHEAQCGVGSDKKKTPNSYLGVPSVQTDSLNAVYQYFSVGFFFGVPAHTYTASSVPTHQ